MARVYIKLFIKKLIKAHELIENKGGTLSKVEYMYFINTIKIYLVH